MGLATLTLTLTLSLALTRVAHLLRGARRVALHDVARALDPREVLAGGAQLAEHRLVRARARVRVRVRVRVATPNPNPNPKP